MTDWPALLARLEARGIDAQQACHVARSTIWKWRYGGVVPATEHAVTLAMLDAKNSMTQDMISAGESVLLQHIDGGAISGRVSADDLAVMVYVAMVTSRRKIVEDVSPEKQELR